jgi:probable addiction module antidote protein
MMPLDTLPFDAAAYLSRPVAQVELLEDAVQSGELAYIAVALGVIARARGMSGIADEAGITREAPYRELSAEQDPKLSTLLGVVRALGVRLKVETAG